MAWLTDRVSRLRGFPAPLGPEQRARFSSWQVPMGAYLFVHSRPYSIGAPAWVVNAPQAEYNPIGAGIVPRFGFASERPSTQYVSGAWLYSPQQLPVAMPMAGLVDPATLAAILPTLPAQGPVYRVL